jgi:hypothetical protein
LLRNKKHGSNALPLAAAYARQPGETAAKNIRRREIFIIQIRFGGYFLLLRNKKHGSNALPLAAAYARQPGETAAKNIRRREIFIIQIRFGGYFLFFCLQNRYFFKIWLQILR